MNTTTTEAQAPKKVEIEGWIVDQLKDMVRPVPEHIHDEIKRRVARFLCAQLVQDHLRITIWGMIPLAKERTVVFVTVCGPFAKYREGLNLRLDLDLSRELH